MKTIKVTYNDGSTSFWDYSESKVNELLRIAALSHTQMIVSIVIN